MKGFLGCHTYDMLKFNVLELVAHWWVRIEQLNSPVTLDRVLTIDVA